jgi:hypothetical protein
MSPSRLLALLAAVAVAGPAAAADLAKVDRTLKREPAYRSPPRYALVVFGPEATERVWLVHDGDALYVDRNGNGDLTDPGERVAARDAKGLSAEDVGYTFEVGELRVGGRVHKGLTVWASPRAHLLDSVTAQPNVKAALAADPKGFIYSLGLDADLPGLKGQGVGGRVPVIAGPSDVNGVLMFAPRPADAPVIHVGGPLAVTLYGERPELRLGRACDLMLAVGTPGHGPGTLAMLCYDETIPAAARPKIEAEFPPSQPGGPPVREQFELKERC